VAKFTESKNKGTGDHQARNGFHWSTPWDLLVDTPRVLTFSRTLSKWEIGNSRWGG
jgi:hypothetical protein